MCHNSMLERTEQIEKCLENGMPQKIVKSVVYTLKKRVGAAQNHFLQKQTEFEMKENAEFSLITNTTETPQTSTSNFKIPKMCGRFRQQQQMQQKDKISNIETISHDDSTLSLAVKPYTDVLSIGTAYTKLLFEHLSRITEEFRKSKTYSLLTQTTQPAHFIAICILSAVLLTIWPDLTDSTSKTTITASSSLSSSQHDAQQLNGKSTLAAIVYLGALAAHFGAQIWMTFISGLSLYFSLPRHTFGQCQQILFPKYFAFNAVLSIILLIIFVKFFMHTWSGAIAVQLATLIVNPVIEVTIRLYLAPPMLRLMHEKYKIEGAIGSGTEIGSIVQGDLSQCPHYQRIHKAFRRLHMTVAMGNMIVLLATCMQLYFLASKIRI